MNKILPKDTLVLLAIIWVIFIVDVILPFINFNTFGIRPREVSGLPGILLSPFLHHGLGHIVSNSISLLGTSILVRMAVGTVGLRQVLIFSALLGGLGTWLFSTGGIVVGASGVVYGLIGFLFAQAYFNPSIKGWAVALLSLIFFGGALLSFFSFSPYISWAAHFWGAIAGVGAAYVFKPKVADNPAI